MKGKRIDVKKALSKSDMAKVGGSQDRQGGGGGRGGPGGPWGTGGGRQDWNSSNNFGGSGGGWGKNAVYPHIFVRRYHNYLTTF